MLQQLGSRAKHNRFHETWTTVGVMKTGKSWSDDGRISQYDVTREALCGMGEIKRDLAEGELHPPLARLGWPRRRDYIQQVEGRV